MRASFRLRLLRSVRTGKEWVEPISGIFVAVGHHPNTEFPQGILELDEQGYVVTRNGVETAWRESLQRAMCMTDIIDRLSLPPGFRLHGRIESGAMAGNAFRKDIVDTQKKFSIAYYISSHGYGHGVRSCSIIRTINAYTRN